MFLTGENSVILYFPKWTSRKIFMEICFATLWFLWKLIHFIIHLLWNERFEVQTMSRNKLPKMIDEYVNITKSLSFILLEQETYLLGEILIKYSNIHTIWIKNKWFGLNGTSIRFSKWGIHQCVGKKSL